MAEKDDKKKKPTSKFTSKYLRDLPINQERYRSVDGLSLQKPTAAELADYETLIARQAAGTNFGFAPNRYIAPGAKLNPFTDELNAAGFVLEKTPNEVWVDTMHPRQDYVQKFDNTRGLSSLAQDMLRQKMDRGAVDLLAHEMTHSKQHNNPAYITMTPQEHAAYEALARNYERATMMENIPDRYKNPLRGSGTDPYELGAYLSGYEATHPVANTKEGIATLMPIENTQLGSEIVPKGALDSLKALFGLDYMKDPMAVEVMKRLMGQQTPTDKKKK